MSNFTDVIFDLDGTIIDSVPGIQQGYDLGFLEVNGIENKVDISPYIGPPIRGIYQQLTGETEEAIVERFGLAFQKNYDAEGYKMSVMYEGIIDVFNELKSRAIRMHIATYKRHIPTIKILDHLDILSFFNSVYTVDKFGFSFQNKSEMVKDLVEKQNISPQHSIFVGDTHHDRIASLENNIIFAFANYGYGSIEGANIVLKKPLDLLNYI